MDNISVNRNRFTVNLTDSMTGSGKQRPVFFICNDIIDIMFMLPYKNTQIKRILTLT